MWRKCIGQLEQVNDNACFIMASVQSWTGTIAKSYSLVKSPSLANLVIWVGARLMSSYTRMDVASLVSSAAVFDIPRTDGKKRWGSLGQIHAIDRPPGNNRTKQKRPK